MNAFLPPFGLTALTNPIVNNIFTQQTNVRGTPEPPHENKYWVNENGTQFVDENGNKFIFVSPGS